MNIDQYLDHEYGREAPLGSRGYPCSPLMRIALAKWMSDIEAVRRNRELGLAIAQIRARASESGVALTVAQERVFAIECSRNRLANLDEAISRAYSRVRDIELGIGTEHGSNSAIKRNRARECARRLSQVVDRARALDRAVMICQVIGYAPASCLRRSAELIRALKCARRCAPDDLVHDRERMPAAHIDDALVVAYNITHDLRGASIASPIKAIRRERITKRDVSLMAQRLVSMAALLLPRAVQDRYLEEYFCELREIADGGKGLSGQLVYVSRLLVGSLPMRVALLTPREKRASQ